MKNQELDYVLVPLGITTMVIYHLCLGYRIVHHPEETSIGINSINRQIWVHIMMEDTVKNGVCAVQTLRNNIMASTLLVSTSIMFTSVIAALIASKTHPDHGFIYGNRSELGLPMKFFAILAFVFLAILFNVQSVRYYSDASNLINVQGRKGSINLTAEYIGRIVNMGNYFWLLGLRSFYASFPMFMWLLGPIPMFLCSVILVIMLCFLDFFIDTAGCRALEVKDEETGIK